MSSKEGGKRPKRRCVTKGKNMPSAVHYVGYVEDGETPEMIMRKFEELEKVMNAVQPEKGPGDDEEHPEVADDRSRSNAGASTSQALNEDQLMQVFRQTSVFNVRTLLQNNEVLMTFDNPGTHDDKGSQSADDLLSSDEDDQWDYIRGFWSDEDQIASGARRFKKKRGPQGERPSRPRVPSQRLRHAVVTQFNRDTNAFIRRKVKIIDKDALVQLRIPPPPIPASWGRAVKPYRPPAQQPKDDPSTSGTDRSNFMATPSISDFDFKTLTKKYQAILINPGWDSQSPAHNSDSAARSSKASSSASSSKGNPVQRLAQLPLVRLCPIGFIFIWAEKEQISPVTRHLSSLGYVYVENLTWVFLHPNHSILTLPHHLSCRSHVTLLIFRRDVEEGRAIELRHQRSPDVIFDCIRHAEGTRWQVPDEVWSSIETMLPMGRGIFLQLWAARGCHRAGWDHLAELPDAAAL